MTNHRKIIFIEFIILAFMQSIDAKNIIVSTAEEMKIAAKKVEPGDTLTLANGEWKDQVITIRAEGTADKPIIIRAETAGKVVLKGKSQLRFSGSYLIVDGLYFTGGALEKNSVIEFRTSSENAASNCRLTNCAIIDYNPDDNEVDYKWVSVYGKKNRIDHNYFRGKTHQGAMLVVWLDGEPLARPVLVEEIPGA